MNMGSTEFRCWLEGVSPSTELRNVPLPLPGRFGILCSLSASFSPEWTDCILHGLNLGEIPRMEVCSGFDVLILKLNKQYYLRYEICCKRQTQKSAQITTYHYKHVSILKTDLKFWNSSVSAPNGFVCVLHAAWFWTRQQFLSGKFVRQDDESSSMF